MTNDLNALFEMIDKVAEKIPLGTKETRDEIGLSLSQWYRLRKGVCSNAMPRTIRKMKAFIEKYKDAE